MGIDTKKFWGNFLFGLGIVIMILGINAFPAHTSTHSFDGMMNAIGELGIYFYLSILLLIAGSYLKTSK